MKEQTYFNKFARYSFLSVLGTLGVSCYILADTFFIAKGMGTKGLAALNLAIPVYNFIHGSGLLFGMGGATKFSICKSRKDIKEGNIIFSNTACMAVFVGILFALAGVFLAEPLALVLGADADIFEMTATYLRWLLLFAPAFIMNDVLLCFVRNDEDPLLSSVAMLAGSFANIVMDYVFIFPLDMGILGAILATGFSPVISMLIMSLHWIKKKNSFRFAFAKLRGENVRQNFSFGFPSLVAQLATGVSMLIFNMLILNLEGNTGVAAYGVIANIALVVVGIYTGISQGVQPLLSDAYGSGNKKDIRLGLRYAIVTMVIVSVVIYVGIFIFANPITSAFNSENSLRMQEISVAGLKIYFTSVIFVGYNTIISVFFTSTEKTIPAHILSLLRGVILIVPLAFLMSALWEMTGIWLTYPLTEGIVAVLGYAVYKRK